MPKRAGRPSVAQTPAPKSDKIYGSKKNQKGSATEKKSKSINLSDKTINTLKEKLDNFKKSHPAKKNIDLNDLKAVYRRGSGAYSSSHRPTITGGAPNSRAAWSYARVNKFLKKAGGAKVKAAYVQDDDLMADGGLTDGIELKIKDSQDGKFKNFNLLENGRVFAGVSITKDWLNWAYPDDKEWIKLKNNLSKIGVTTKKGEIVGEFYQVTNLYVGKGYNSKYKGKGYAKILMNEVIKYATKNDLLPLFLLAEPDKQEKMSRETLINFYKSFGFKYLGIGTMVYTSKEVEFNQESKYDYADGGVPRGGDCYEAAGQFCMGSVYMAEPVEFVGEPYLVHAEVKGQGKAEGIRFGHAWVEDDENVYDYSNARKIIMPKVVYYAIGDIQTENPLKYQRYTFPEARAKMLKTKHYGSWDIDTKYADGGETEGYRVYINNEYRRTIKDEDLKNYYLDKGFQMNNGKLQIYGNDISFADGGMIAPNGKPSNLTPEQYKLVRTPEFKAWFGDWENDPENASKVVDENGEPKVVYHGSRSAFSIFDIKKSGESSTPANVGFWFTPIKNFAYNFASTTWYGNSKEINVYPVFLSIKSPKIYNSDSEDSGVRYPDSYEKFKIDVWAIDGQDADRANIGGIGMMLKNEKETIKKYRESLENEGFDGIFINKTRYDRREAGGLNDQIVALFPNQIKLADGSNTTFDMNNEDIRFEDGGEASQHITCINCGWEWETADSAESDKYVCHQCGFDNSLFYDGGILKPTMTLEQIAEANLMKDYLKPVSIEYLQEQLEKGMQHEKEHTDSDEVATTIALHHLAERPDYYVELEKMKLEDGGEVSISDEDYEFWIGGDENFGKAIKQDGVIVGGIAYDEDDQQINGIVIKNKFRKKGLAKKTIKALFDKNPDLQRVYVRAVPESKAFWKKIGTDFSNYNEDAGLWEGYVNRFDDGGNVISEDNSPEDIEISDFLNQQKSEAQMVMTCDDSKIYKAMICKTKVEIADKRMSETENPEELNAWNSYKNIWNECLESILNDDMDKYKVGGKTCGCGCGSIYSKGGMFSKGGLAYGNSHDKGGMPMKVKSTGQNIEIEGGEGVVNKRSMQSSKKVEFQGQKMTPCEAVSKINQLGGGVKFKCEEVADIIAEDGNF